MAKLYEHYNDASWDVWMATQDDWWRGQTFTPQDGHIMTYIRASLRRQGSLTTVTFSLRDTEDGKPVPPDLVSYAFAGNSLSTSWAWKEIPLTYKLLEGVMYAICVRHYGDADNCVNWLAKINSTYPRGTALISQNDAVSWNVQPTIDGAFEEWGFKPSGGSNTSKELIQGVFI